MSGSGGSRGDGTGGGGGFIVGDVDSCSKERSGPINSPKAPVLSKLSVGSKLDVAVHMSGKTPILVVLDTSGAVGGSLTFVGYLEIIDCILKRGFKYQAEIIKISGGLYEVRVTSI